MRHHVCETKNDLDCSTSEQKICRVAFTKPGPH